MLSAADEPITACDSRPPHLSAVLERLLPPREAGDEHRSTGKVEAELVTRTLAVLGIKRSPGQANLEPIIEVLEAGQATGLDLDTLFAAAQA
jgi:hypothetical protein